jgi:hypothetical protein
VGEWELLDVTASIPELHEPSESTDLAEVQIRLVNTAAGVSQFDNAFLNHSTYDILQPASIDRVIEVNECDDWKSSGITIHTKMNFEPHNVNGTKYLRLASYNPGKIIELKGYKEFTDLSSETDTVDLTTEFEEVIVWGVCARLMGAMGNILSGNDRSSVLNRSKEYEQKYEAGKLKRSRVLGTKRLNKVV